MLENGWLTSEFLLSSDKIANWWKSLSRPVQVDRFLIWGAHVMCPCGFWVILLIILSAYVGANGFLLRSRKLFIPHPKGCEMTGSGEKTGTEKIWWAYRWLGPSALVCNLKNEIEATSLNTHVNISLLNNMNQRPQDLPAGSPNWLHHKILLFALYFLRNGGGVAQFQPLRWWAIHLQWH